MLEYLIPFGIPLLMLLVMLTFVIGGVVMTIRLLSRRATEFGYPSTGAYLRAVPQTDAEKRDAVDLTLRGVALCVLGALFSPFVLIGLVPMFYGGRKVAYASLGLGLVDDPQHPRA